MRLFIASQVHIFDYTLLQKSFIPILRGKWVETHNLHLTWYFIGDTMSPDVAIAIMQKIRRVLHDPIPLKGLDLFGKPPYILYGKSDHKALYEQAACFGEVGFEMRRFKPHATLCRIKACADVKAFYRIVQGFQRDVIGEILPNITLYRSHLGDKGPRYEALYTL